MSARPPGPQAARRVPYHLAVALGLSTAAYSSTLAIVDHLQIQSDLALIADRGPVGHAIEVLRANHDRMAMALEEARARFGSGSDAYLALAAGLEDLRRNLADLDRTVGAVEGVSGSLPGQVHLPKVPVISAPAPAPNGHGTTGASGGG